MSGLPVDPFVETLGDELVGAHRRLQRRHTRRRRLASAAAFAAAITVCGLLVAALVDPDTASAHPIRIDEAADGSRVVTIVDPGATAAAIGEALRGAGIDNRTDGRTTGPSRQGTVLSLALAGRQSSPDTADPHVIVIPAGFQGRVELVVGVAAKPGQPYEQPTDPFAPGEPLAGFTDREPHALATRAAEVGLDVRIIAADGRRLAGVPDHAVLLVATMTASDEITLRLA